MDETKINELNDTIGHLENSMDDLKNNLLKTESELKKYVDSYNSLFQENYRLRQSFIANEKKLLEHERIILNENKIPMYAGVNNA